MHVVLLTTSPLSDKTYGGVQTFAVSLRNWLIRRSISVTFVGRSLFSVTVTRPTDDLIKKDRSSVSTSGARIGLPYFIYSLSMFLVSLLMILAVLSINKKSRITCIHAQNTGYCGLAGIISARLLNVPLIVSSHGLRIATLNASIINFSKKISILFEHWLDVITTKHSDLLIVMNSYETSYYKKLGVRQDKIRKIPIGIKTHKFRSSIDMRQHLRKELGVKNNFTIGFVGRFSKEKNLVTLLMAFAKALEHNNKMKLVLVGDGPVRKELHLIANKLGIVNDVIFTGIRYDVNRILSAIDLFILPSYTEGCPTSLIEAMAAGKAIVASDISGVQEVVGNGEEAVLISPHSVDALKQAILFLSSDSALRVKLSDRAKEKARLYDEDTVFSLILKTYRELRHVNQ